MSVHMNGSHCVMAFNAMLSRQEIVEKYSIPPDLESEVFSIVRAVYGSGVNARYLESLVDQQLHQYFEKKDRLRMKDAWSYPKEEHSMRQTWADTVAAEEEASNVGGLNEVIEDGEDGILVPPGDFKELASALRRSFEDKELHSRISKGAKLSAEKAFKVSDMAEKLYCLYDEVLKESQNE